VAHNNTRQKALNVGHVLLNVWCHLNPLTSFFSRDLFQSVGSWNPASLKELSSLNPEDSLQMLYQYNMNNKCFVLLPQINYIYIYIYFYSCWNATTHLQQGVGLLLCVFIWGSGLVLTYIYLYITLPLTPRWKVASIANSQKQARPQTANREVGH